MTVVQGVVKEVQVISDSRLPEGIRVEVHVLGDRPDVPADLQAEFEAWGRASDRALELVDRLTSDDQSDAVR